MHGQVVRATTVLTTADILRLRPHKNSVDPNVPNGFFIEQECSAAGHIEQVATILLTGRECVFHCLMCDLWKNTLDGPTPRGAISRQIDFALQRLPPATSLKLYNSSNFFDPLAVPTEDYADIAQRARQFHNVVVENHPKLCGDRCLDFVEQLKPTKLEVAMGLETVHEPSLSALNKQMTLQDFQRATKYLISAGIAVRAFVLLKLPDMTEEQGVEWAVRSLRAAFEMGVETCSVIPVRTGNGAMEWLQSTERFAPPSLHSLELVLEEGLRMASGRVFADLWDAQRFATCEQCAASRIERLKNMNLYQRVFPTVTCTACNL